MRESEGRTDRRTDGDRERGGQRQGGGGEGEGMARAAAKQPQRHEGQADAAVTGEAVRPLVRHLRSGQQPGGVNWAEPQLRQHLARNGSQRRRQRTTADSGGRQTAAVRGH